MLQLGNTQVMNRVLVIDADRDFLHELKQKLTPYNYEVHTVSDPKDIFDLLYRYQPDILLVNYILNDGNGGTISHQIKSNPDTHDIPVIMMSDYGDLCHLWKKFGCNDYVLKPIQTSTLVEKMDFWLKNARIPILH